MSWNEEELLKQLDEYFDNNSKETVVKDFVEAGGHFEEEDLMYNADPNCDHKIELVPDGGIKCTKCSGWFCY